MGMMAGFGLGLLAWAIGLPVAHFPQQMQDPLPISTLPLHLVGVIVDRGAPSRSASLIDCTYPEQKRERFVAGETACDLAEIKEIRPDGVIIANLLTSRLELLTLSSEKPSTGAPPPPPPVFAAASDLVAVDLRKESIDYYLGNLPALLESALATPHYREAANGQRSIDGFEIGRIAKGGAVEQLGLRDGDVILEVNGQPLDGLATAIRLLGQIQSMPQAKMTVLRNGHRLTFVFNRK